MATSTSPPQLLMRHSFDRFTVTQCNNEMHANREYVVFAKQDILIFSDKNFLFLLIYVAAHDTIQENQELDSQRGISAYIHTAFETVK